ncbi:class III signal peptide-containing protein [Thermococcus sp. MV11]|uniref:class III signal peptide-containing protein n=1 Tax=Thermococcus sp. MV11 TaxID=1638267 RepID=UPI00142FF99D|nr:class III signal peptide-containing protein [Thermococcus sp. MV11]NJE03775.1 class III signal peptide-containing protein [Thermococcus sp. MV11]
MKLVRRGQVSLEFMLVFGIMLVLMLYSVNSVTFKEGSTSTETLKMQVLLEEKSLANAIAGTIAQVYAQGPGAKSTTYAKVTYLAEPDYLQKAFGSAKVSVGSSGNLVFVGVGDNLITEDANGAEKNTVTTEMPYTSKGKGILFPDGLPSKSIRIIVEWDPSRDEDWSAAVVGSYLEITININPGG